MMTTDKTKTMKRLTRVVVTFVMFDSNIASLVIRRHNGGVYN
jgi:hypothetical protein